MSSIYDDTMKEFLNRVGEDESLELLNIAKTIAYSQELRYKKELVAKAEFLNPTSERVLLMKLFNSGGGVRFKKPLTIEATLKPKEDISLNNKTLFASNQATFHLNVSHDLELKAGVETKLIFTLDTPKEIKAKLNTNSLITKIPTGYTYKEITRVTGLNISQMFTKPNSNAMFDVDSNGIINIVILNKMFDSTDTVTFTVFINNIKDVAIPTALFYTDKPNLFTTINIKVLEEETKPMTLEEMKISLRYLNPKNGLIGSIKELINREVEEVNGVGVWFRRYTMMISIGNDSDELREVIRDLIDYERMSFIPPRYSIVPIKIIVYNGEDEPLEETLINSIKSTLEGFSSKNIKTEAYKRLRDLVGSRHINFKIVMYRNIIGNNKARFYNMAVDEVELR